MLVLAVHLICAPVDPWPILDSPINTKDRALEGRALEG